MEKVCKKVSTVPSAWRRRGKVETSRQGEDVIWNRVRLRQGRRRRGMQMHSWTICHCSSSVMSSSTKLRFRRVSHLDSWPIQEHEQNQVLTVELY